MQFKLHHHHKAERLTQVHLSTGNVCCSTRDCGQDLGELHSLEICNQAGPRRVCSRTQNELSARAVLDSKGSVREILEANRHGDGVGVYSICSAKRFVLAMVEQEWLGERKSESFVVSRVREALEEATLAEPKYWQGYYRGDDEALRFARKYSLRDRRRYHWPQPAVMAAFQRLLRNLTSHPAPVALLSQYLPKQSEAVRSGVLANDPAEVIRSKLSELIDQYADACGFMEDRAIAYF